MFPGNIDMADKTLHNWRTEIPALFGFYKENKEILVRRILSDEDFLFITQQLIINCCIFA